MNSFLQEFKAFAMKGNVMDLAIAVVIGAAFGKIVSSLVDNIIMPLVGIFLGGISFSSLSVGVGGANFAYGSFIQSVVDFVIIAFVIFLIIKAMNNMKQEEEPTPEAPAEPSEEVKLLREIRDGLRR
ncbi:MAG: large-conductance mechanosensitive channel protein MscL [Patescibacteria group bacterium]